MRREVEDVMAKLTKVQRNFLEWLGSNPNGVIDITDESIANRLIERGYAIKFFESDGQLFRPVWAITKSGRSALTQGE
jgi:hypothetical protein